MKKKSTRISRTLTDDDLAELMDVDERTLRNWKRLGCPCSRGRGKDRRWNAEEVAAWKKTTGITGTKGRPEDTTPASDPLKAAKIRKETALAERYEIATKRERGSVIDRSEVERANVQKFTTIRNKMLGLPAAIAPSLVGLQAPDIEKLLDDRITEILTELSRK